VYGHDRQEAIDRMLFSLGRLRIDGIRTNVALQKFIVGHPDFRGNGISTRWLEQTGLPDYLTTLEE
jgi:biotin carboxylase